jgi:hypothetical protein
VTWNLLITNGCGCLVGEYVKSLSDFGHLFGNSISPKGIAILAVELKGFFNSLTPKSCSGPDGGNKKLPLGRLFAS